MEISIEPERFAKLLKNALITNLLDNTVIEFREKGIRFQDVSLGTAFVVGIFSEKYFLRYEAKNENVPVASSLLSALGHGFKDKKITVRTEGDSIIMEGSVDHYKEPMLDIEKTEFPIELVVSEYGVIPKKREPEVLVKLPTNALNLPPASQYNFVSDGESLKAVITDIGTYTRTLKPEKTVKMNKLDVKFSQKYYEAIMANFDKSVWLALYTDAMVVSKREKDWMLTYSVGVTEE